MTSRKTILAAAVAAIFFLLASSSVSAIFDWYTCGNTPMNWNYADGTALWNDITSAANVTTKTTLRGSGFQPLVYDIDMDGAKEIIAEEAGILTLYTSSGLEKDSTTTGNIHGQPYIGMLSGNASRRELAIVTKDSFRSIRYTGTWHTDFSFSLNFTAANGGRGNPEIKCANGNCYFITLTTSNPFAALIRVNMTAGTYQNISACADASSWCNGWGTNSMVWDANGDCSGGACGAPLAIGDLNNDGYQEGCTIGGYPGSTGGKLNCFSLEENFGALIMSYSLDGYFNCNIPIMANLNNAGDMEVVTACRKNAGNRVMLFAISSYGTDYISPINISAISGTHQTFQFGRVAIGECSGDGQINDIAGFQAFSPNSGQRRSPYNSSIFCIDGMDGTISSSAIVGPQCPSCPATFDLNQSNTVMANMVGLVGNNQNLITPWGISTGTDFDQFFLPGAARITASAANRSISIADFNNDASHYLDIIFGGDRDYRLISSGVSNIPPTLTRSYGLSFANPICPNTTVTFSAQECVTGGTSNCNYDNDYTADSERISVLCGNGSTQVYNGSFSTLSPTVSCRYGLAGSYTASLYLTDSSNPNTLGTATAISVVVASSGTPGSTCNIESQPVGQTVTFTPVTSTSTSSSLRKLFNLITGGDETLDIVVGTILWIIVVGGIFILLAAKGAPIGGSAGAAGAIGLIVFILFTAVGLFPVWLCILVMLAMLMLLVLGVVFMGGS